MAKSENAVVEKQLKILQKGLVKLVARQTRAREKLIAAREEHGKACADVKELNAKIREAKRSS